MAGLREGVIIDVPSWKVPVIMKHRLLTQPEIAVSIKFSTFDVKEMPQPQFEVFEKTFEPLFTAAFRKMSKEWFDETQREIDSFENEMLKQFPIDPRSKEFRPNAREEVVKVANTLIANANRALERRCRKWTEKVGQIAEAAYEKAYEASLRAMQKKVTKAKAKIVAKVALVVALTLTAAALSIFVGVATIPAGTAIAIVVFAAIKTGIEAIKKSVSEVLKNYDAMGKAITALEKDIESIEKANEAIVKASKRTANTFDRLKAFKAYLSADVESLLKHVKDLDKFIAITQDTTMKLTKQLRELADKLDDAKEGTKESKKLATKVLTTQRSIEDTLELLKQIADLKRAAAEVQEAAKKCDPDAAFRPMPKLRKLLKIIKGAADAASRVAGPIKEIVSGVQTLAQPNT
jgi:methyl-accepting chemotaxis protein